MTAHATDPDLYARQVAACVLIGHLQDRGYFVGETLPVVIRTDHARAELSVLVALNPELEEPDRDDLNDEALKIMAAFSSDHDYDEEDALRAMLATVPFAWPTTVPHPHEADC